MALHDVLKDWVVSELSVPHASVNGHALCPFAKNAWFANKVKLREEKDNLWDAVYEEIQAFDDTYQVVICASYLHKQSYDDLEASCFALNGWLATTGHDIWLLAFKEKKLSLLFNSSSSDRSKNNEKTLYLKKCFFGLNLLWITLPLYILELIIKVFQHFNG